MKTTKTTQLAIATLLLGSASACNSISAQDMQSIIDMGTQVASAKGVNVGNSTQLTSGLKQMLSLSSDRASSALSSANVWQLLLPPEAQKMVGTLRSVGLGRYVDSAQLNLNKAASQAALASAPVFKQAINNMSVNDALSIWRGGSSAGTQYFRNQTETQLRAKFAPIVQKSMQDTGFYGTYQTALNAYNAIPLSTKPSIDVEGYLVGKTMDSVFNRMALEETAIRKDPKARGDALIQAAMGALIK